MKELKSYLVELCGEYLPSGFEHRASAAMSLLAPLVDECRRDRAGGVLGYRKAALPFAPRLLLDAHLDEIALMVTKIDENGFIHFTNLAGFSSVSLPASGVTVCGRRPLPGVIATLPPHLLTDEERNQPLPMDKMVIDIGYSADRARELVRVGDPVLLRRGCADLLNDRVTGKALDNRAGVAVLLKVLYMLRKMPLPVDLYVSFSAGEEFSGFGARHAAWEVDPDEAIVVDVTHGASAETPAGKAFPLGSGAAVGIAPVLNGDVTACLLKLAEQHGISYVREAMPGRTGTNSDSIAVSRAGVAVGMVSVPLRYMHSGAEVVDLKDMSACADLIYHYVNRGGVTRHE